MTVALHWEIHEAQAHKGWLTISHATRRAKESTLRRNVVLDEGARARARACVCVPRGRGGGGRRFIGGTTKPSCERPRGQVRAKRGRGYKPVIADTTRNHRPGLIVPPDTDLKMDVCTFLGPPFVSRDRSSPDSCGRVTRSVVVTPPTPPSL
jgi:hypothetical protein